MAVAIQDNVGRARMVMDALHREFVYLLEAPIQGDIQDALARHDGSVRFVRDFGFCQSLEGLDTELPIMQVAHHAWRPRKPLLQPERRCVRE